MKPDKKRFYSFLPLLTIAVIFAAWWTATNLFEVKASIFPSPQAVWDAFLTICRSGYKNHTLLEHFASSMGRLGAAFLIAVFTAIPLGLASGYSPLLRGLMDPVVEFYRPLPPLAYYTLLVLWFGIGNSSKIILLFLACFAPIYIACVSAVLKIPDNYIACAQTLGAGKRQIFFHVVLPSCLPDIFTGVRTAIGVGYTTLVAAEMVAARSGIGWMVLDASNYLRSDIVFCVILIMGITGILIDLALRALEKHIVPWKGRI